MSLQGETQTVRGKGAQPAQDRVPFPEARTTGRSLCRLRSESEGGRSQGTSFSSSGFRSHPRLHAQSSFLILTQNKGCISKNIIYFC